MMKKTLVSALLLMLTLALCASAFAADTIPAADAAPVADASTAAQNGRGAGMHHGNHAFVDANGDGICDNVSGNHAFVDANGDGICDNVSGNCAFVDANGDGICDNRANGGSQSGCRRGTGSQAGHHNGRQGGSHR